MKKEGNFLKGFFNPKTIAVVGASEDFGKVGGILMKKLNFFQGNVIPINIHKDLIFGKKAYSSVLNYPGEIDLGVIATPAITIKNIILDCIKKKIKNIIVISAGFSEVGNVSLEREIVALAKKNNINLLGPNCFGLANPFVSLDLTFSNTSSKKGNVAFISQSGALWSYISDFKNLGFSGFVSLGNMADLDFTDFIEYFSLDKNTKKIILYVEKLKEGKKFIEVCKKCKKEILVIKAGKTEKGIKAAVSHTGSLATDFKIYSGVFNQAQIKVVNSLAIAIGKTQENIFSKLKGNKVAIITNAGGAMALMTDFLEEKGFKVEDSIDLLGTALAKDYKNELSKTKYSRYDSLIVVLTPQSMSEPNLTAKAILESKYKKKIIACFLGENYVEEAVRSLKKGGVPVFTHCC